MRMAAFDADDASTDNALLRYNILRQTPTKPSPNMFYIDPEKGDIVTVVSPALLDREITIPQIKPIYSELENQWKGMTMAAFLSAFHRSLVIHEIMMMCPCKKPGLSRMAVMAG
ncbi:hypothetical protein DUI87_14282 [Hirundo rustica rustica]|uniref:Cadherin domain-containing protein n=1 Tax=Hirundo rustica rustica TaxID=333673 RepID=A0A3M0KDF8_HIRRU|nr:hypothetical protein DUI87_14282 [Hirundo rustica rustica]